MSKIVILGSGAAPGVPALANGWGNCDPNNPKNIRRRNCSYVEIGGAKLLIDTSPDLHNQLIDNHIRYLDAVLYTHSHADHLHGINDLRDLNRISGKPLDVYANADTKHVIETCFSYLVANKNHPNNPLYKPSLILHEAVQEKPFQIKNVEITPLLLTGHAVASIGYMFNGGDLVYIADCREIAPQSLALIRKRPKILVMPLTTRHQLVYHMGLETLLSYVEQIKPERAIISHMAVECDYAEIDRLTPSYVTPAFDNMTLEF